MLARPLGALGRIGDWAVDRARRTDAMLVARDQRHRRWVVAFDLTLFTVAVVGTGLMPATGAPWQVRLVAGFVVGVEVGRCAVIGVRRAHAYRTGWLAGRSQMLWAMAEAQRRGMTQVEWLEGELARDYAALGLERPGEE